VAVALFVGGVLLGGCNPKKKIQLRYERPADITVPGEIKRIGIAEFGGTSPEDKRWGTIASDRLAAALAEYNRKYHRYELVDRQRLKAILDERDLQIAISDGATAGKAGKLANVQGMIYGSVRATAKETRANRQQFDPLKMTTKTVYYTHRYCVATVNFTMDDIRTGKTLATATTSREYDSDKGDSKFSMVKKVVGLGSDAGELDKIVARLVDDCVHDFLRQISPHEVVVTEEVQPGKSPVVGTGNKLAAAGDYSEALECYEAGMKQKPSDHEATFNAGVMQEALGRFAQAEALYDKAFKMDPKERYVLARKRVRAEK